MLYYLIDIIPKIQAFSKKLDDKSLLTSLFPRLVEPLRPRDCVSRPANLRQQHKRLISKTLRVILN